MTPPTVATTLHCPACGHQETEEMPTDACRVFWTCPACGETARPLPGDCCVYCSYADDLCPPKQAEAAT